MATRSPAAISTARLIPASAMAIAPRLEGAASAPASRTSVFIGRRSGNRAGLGFQQLPGVLAELTAPFLVEPGRLQLGPEGGRVHGADLQPLAGELLLERVVQLEHVLA